MEWIVPVLFVLATAAQWWLKRRQETEDSAVPPPIRRGSSPTPSPEPEPFEDLGDLLEALGRRRHESPPPVVQTPSQNPVPAPAWVPAIAPVPPAPLIPTPTPIPPVMVGEKPNPRRRPPARSTQPPIRSRLRDAVVLSEILAPPLALR